MAHPHDNGERSPRPLTWLRPIGIGLVLCFLGLPLASANEELRILTSYQPAMVAPLVDAFQEAHPDVRVRMLNKSTYAAVHEVLAGNERQFDVFWATAPEAFVVLDEAGALSDSSYADFAWSAVGWTWQHGTEPFEPPQDWNELLDPRYSQQIAMSHPMRSGTMHALVESILQDRGWQAGWAWFLELAGQLNTISSRSFGVLEGVERGDFKLGLSVDFLALTRAHTGLVFRYGRPVIMIPARVATLKRGSSPQLARAFTEFVVSEAGQQLLLEPEVRRIPIHPSVQASLTESLHPEVRAALNFSWSRYDPQLAAQRYWVVQHIFETFIARDLLLRRELWRRFRALEHIPTLEANQIRRLLTWMPVSEHQARSAPSNRETLLQWSERSHTLLRDVDARLKQWEQP